MADFITLHPEEWVGLISGLRFSAAVAQAKFLLIPVVILVLGLSLLIWLQRLEKDREWNAFILWLIFSSAIILSSFRTQKVVVELNPIILNSNSMMLSVKQEEVKVDEKNQTLYVETPTSGISALLALPDKVASLMFNFMDGNILRTLTGQERTIPLDLMACKDPRYAAGLINTLALDWALGVSMKEDDSIEHFSARVDAFEHCYAEGFNGAFAFVHKVGENFKLAIMPHNLAEAAGRGMEVLAKAGSLLWLILKILPSTRVATTVGGVALTLLSGVSDKVFDLIEHPADKVLLNCGQFEEAFKAIAMDIANQCEKIVGEPKDKNTYVNTVLACFKDPTDGPCLDLKNRTLNALEQAKQMVDKQMNIRSDTPV
ncbi:MAG: hypothetical protein JHC25_07785, partial [Thermodesulfobacterium sp.]|nr:hypothetical protein [Thermodesulfobacterium sp.]